MGYTGRVVARREKVREASAGGPAMWIIKVRGNVIGRIERFRDTRTTKNPYKAFDADGNMIAVYWPQHDLQIRSDLIYEAGPTPYPSRAGGLKDAQECIREAAGDAGI